MSTSSSIQQQEGPARDLRNYEFVRTISQGGFGVVKLFTQKNSGEQVAVKIMPLREHLRHMVEAEVINHRMLRHPHIIRFKEVLLAPSDLHLAMEYASEGTLLSYMKQAGRLQERAARWFFHQLILALDFCHNKSVAHRDVKLENTLLVKEPDVPLPILKLCDFGCSTSGPFALGKVGTPTYMAPEICLHNAPGTPAMYDAFAADLWSCGVLLYTLLLGSLPFQSHCTQGLQCSSYSSSLAAVQGRVSTLLDSRAAALTPAARDLLAQLLTASPSKRVTMAGVMQHEWFLTDLPPAALGMNEQCLSQVPEHEHELQSEQSVRAVLRQAWQQGQLQQQEPSQEQPPTWQQAPVMLPESPPQQQEPSLLLPLLSMDQLLPWPSSLFQLPPSLHQEQQQQQRVQPKRPAEVADAPAEQAHVRWGPPPSLQSPPTPAQKQICWAPPAPLPVQEQQIAWAPPPLLSLQPQFWGLGVGLGLVSIEPAQCIRASKRPRRSCVRY